MRTYQPFRRFPHPLIVVVAFLVLIAVGCDAVGGRPGDRSEYIAERTDGLLMVEMMPLTSQWHIYTNYHFWARVTNLDTADMKIEKIEALSSANVKMATVEFEQSVNPDDTKSIPLQGRCTEEGNGSVSLHVEAVAMDGERFRATVDSSMDCYRPATIHIGLEDQGFTSVAVIEKEGEQFPVAQFVPVGESESGIYWSTESGQLVFPVNGGEWLPNPDPDGEGFGLVNDTEIVSIEVPVADWEQFCEEVSSFASGAPGQSSRGYDLILDECQQPVFMLEFDAEPTSQASPVTTGTRPTATPASRGVLVSVLKIGDAHYYIHQFDHLRSPGLPVGEPGRYSCGDNQYAVHLAGLLNEARSFEYPDEPIQDLDPTGCGFGLTESFVSDGPDADPFTSVLQADFPQARFTARVIGEWCRRVLPDLAGQNNAIQNLCERNPPQD